MARLMPSYMTCGLHPAHRVHAPTHPWGLRMITSNMLGMRARNCSRVEASGASKRSSAMLAVSLMRPTVLPHPGRKPSSAMGFFTLLKLSCSQPVESAGRHGALQDVSALAEIASAAGISCSQSWPAGTQWGVWDDLVPCWSLNVESRGFFAFKVSL